MKNLNLSILIAFGETKSNCIFVSLKQFIYSNFQLLKAGLLLMVIVLASEPTAANSFVINHKFDFVETIGKQVETLKSADADYLIKGVIKSEEGELMPGVNIYLKNGTEGTVSDLDGKFEFPKKLKEGDVLIFSFLGYDKVEYVISDEPQLPIEITMVFETGIIMGKVAVDDVYAPKSTGFRKFWERLKSSF